MKNINDFYNVSNSFLIDCLYCFFVLFCFCYQGQKGEPGDIVDVSMNPLQVVAQRMLTIKGAKWPRWHSSRKVTNDQICVSILLLMHIRRFIIFFSIYEFVLNHRYLCTVEFGVLKVPSVPQIDNSFMSLISFVPHWIIGGKVNINYRQITMSNNSLRETWEDKNYIPWA